MKNSTTNAARELLPTPCGWVRTKNDRYELHIGKDMPPDRSNGNAGHWVAIFDTPNVLAALTTALTQQQGGEQEAGGVRWTSFTKPDGAGGFTIDPSVLDSPLYADQMRAVKEMARGKHKETTEETKLRTKQPAASEGVLSISCVRPL